MISSAGREDPLITAHETARQAYNLAAPRYHELFHDELDRKPFDRDLLDSFAAGFPRGALVCDAGCGPSATIGRYLADRGLVVIGVDISDTCVAMARRLNPDLRIERADISRMPLPAQSVEGIVSYYSIIHTPGDCLGTLFGEFRRILKPYGRLLVAVKAGTTEGYVPELLGMPAEIYFTYFTEQQLRGLFAGAGLQVDRLERRNPYEEEIRQDRIFAIGMKP